jgi:hypothetical protein
MGEDSEKVFRHGIIYRGSQERNSKVENMNLETRGSARTVNRGSLPCIANRKNGDTVE